MVGAKKKHPESQSRLGSTPVCGQPNACRPDVGRGNDLPRVKSSTAALSQTPHRLCRLPWRGITTALALGPAANDFWVAAQTVRSDDRKNGKWTSTQPRFCTGWSTLEGGENPIEPMMQKDKELWQLLIKAKKTILSWLRDECRCQSIHPQPPLPLVVPLSRFRCAGGHRGVAEIRTPWRASGEPAKPVNNWQLTASPPR